MEIIPVPCLSDNFAYLLISPENREAAVVDPSESEPVLMALTSNRLTLSCILNTHHHWDHVGGNKELAQEFSDLKVYGHRHDETRTPCITNMIDEGDTVRIGNLEASFLFVPCHTSGHIVAYFEAEKLMFTGDTLFNAGVGNCGNGGDPEVMYQTISEQFHTLDDNIVIYPGHEYLENNLRFTLSFEPDNAQALAWLERAMAADPGISPLTTTIGDERTFNSFFRLHSEQIRSALDCMDKTDKEVFVALRSPRDKW